MANLTLPESFQTKLKENASLNGLVYSTIATFSEILQDNKLYFFEEYTDHGIRHIERVLAASDNLIEPKSAVFLTSEDIGYYILAVILHDIGMHLTLDGFKALLAGKMDAFRVEQLDKKTWGESWEEFLSEMRRTSSKKLKGIFGEEDLSIRTPPLDQPDSLNGHDKKLIGEFIRRHHARLAHEIALHGFPGQVYPLYFARDLDLKIKNIVGLIARSHGMDLRTCIDYLENKYGKSSKRLPFGIQAPFLMVLLRLADYIQIDRSRSSSTLIRLKTFASSISEMEHYAHLAIDAVDSQYQDDPELIYVTASPKDSNMYLKLKNLFQQIQQEFDLSWAVLGELYGHFKDNRPEIRYRRIRSNLTDETFLQRQDYVSDSFSFKANDDIIKLLIAPLYGDSITYGVRELLQNAIDACIERGKEESKKGNPNYTPLVEIDVQTEGENPIFRITDNGIGMDVEVIKNYFLRAGATYRDSQQWKSQYLDDEGNSSIRRSGRFGVGALAALLLGEELEVETRKVGSTMGYRFRVGINLSQINVQKDPLIKEGTRIAIKLYRNKLDQFEPNKARNGFYRNPIQWYEWYTLASPTIHYRFNGESIANRYKWEIDIEKNKFQKWMTIEFKGFDKILWKHRLSHVRNNRYICNGFIIPDGMDDDADSLGFSLLGNVPSICIFDSSANLPLTLNRNKIDGRLSFAQDLAKDIYKDYIAYLLMFNRMSFVKNSSIRVNRGVLNYPGRRRVFSSTPFTYGFNNYNAANINYRSYGLEKILVSKQGFIIDYNYFVRKLGQVKAIMIQSQIAESQTLKLNLRDHYCYFLTHEIRSSSDYTSAIIPENSNIVGRGHIPYEARVFMKTSQFNNLFEPKTRKITEILGAATDLIVRNKDWIGFDLDKPTIKSLITEEFLTQQGKKLNFIREYIIECHFEGDPILDELLARYVGDEVVIPYSLEERKKKYPLAFEELGKYMEKYLQKDEEQKRMPPKILS